MMSTYYVSKQGDDQNVGNQVEPFLTINHAAQIAKAGDAIIVHQGIYREQIDPQQSGTATQRITYRAAAGEHVTISGAEVVTNWQRVEQGVWQTVIDNQLFGNFNPFAQQLQGDWLEQSNGRHAGELYVNGQSLYEANMLDEVLAGVQRQTVTEYITNVTLPDPHADQTKYLWFAEVGKNQTTLVANFQDLDPNQQLTEVNVRQTCFYPSRTGINDITITGFEICQAATPWAPPTTEQVGMVGPHWAKGWVIEDNNLHDAKCSAISLGTPQLGEENAFSKRHDKPGYQYQLEKVFEAQRLGWNRETVGSHLIRNNEIHHCGQGGIIGNLGGVFSDIRHNHIYEIGMKFEFGGWEIAALKLHAGIDTVIEDNQIDHNTLGTWLDWQAQGTQILRNLYHHNLRDLLIEMCHGPFLVAENILASAHAIDEFSQGGAFINNLIAGETTIENVLNRATPYHLPHSTAIKGYAMVYGSDDRYLNNIFIGTTDQSHTNGTKAYDGSSLSMKDFVQAVEVRLPGDVELFETVRQPAYVNDNVYLQGSRGFGKEQHAFKDADFNAHFVVSQSGKTVKVSLKMPPTFQTFRGHVQSTTTLSPTRLSAMEFENPDGSILRLEHDYFGWPNDNSGESVPGPFSQLRPGENEIVVWESPLE